MESHPDIIISNEFGLMLELTVSRKIHVAMFASDILSLICCIGKIWLFFYSLYISNEFVSDFFLNNSLLLLASNGQLLEPHANEVVSTLNNLLSYEELEVQYNAVGAIFNLTAMRGKPKRISNV